MFAVAEQCILLRKNRDYHPEPQKMRHVQETLQLLTVLTRDHRYEEVYNDAEKGVPGNMCEVLDRIENEGIIRGEEKKARESAKNFYEMGISVENIAKGVGYTIDTVKQWLGLLPA